MRTFNLVRNEEFYFDDKTTPEWACAYGYCQENNLVSALFSSAEDNRFPAFFSTLPVIRGKVSIACGNWMACQS